MIETSESRIYILLFFSKFDVNIAKGVALVNAPLARESEFDFLEASTATDHFPSFLRGSNALIEV